MTIPRSGSTLLQHTLNAHPAALVYGEVFNRSERSRLIAMRAGTDMSAIYKGGSIRRYLQHTVFPPSADGKQVIGFRVFPFHARWLPNPQHLWRQIGAVPGLKILLLERENLLDIALSYSVALRDNVWFASPGEKPRAYQPIRMEYDFCVQAFRDYEQSYAWCREQLPHADRLHVTYDALVHDTDTCLQRIQTWLNLDPIPLRPAHGPVKQRTVPRREAILNFDELRSRMAAEHPEWLAFFDKSEPLLQTASAYSASAQATAISPSEV